jgi:hypothetical protein
MTRSVRREASKASHEKTMRKKSKKAGPQRNISFNLDAAKE